MNTRRVLTHKLDRARQCARPVSDARYTPAMSADSNDPTPALPKQHAPTHRELFLAFLQIGVSAFGGALPWARRVLVDDRKWLGDREFTDILTVCQAVPGPNVVNVSVFVGTTFRGITGGIAAFLGIVGIPLAILLALSQLYHTFSYLPEVKSAMNGMSIVVTAYLVHMSLKMAKPFYKNLWAIALCIVAALLSAFAHWHMALVLVACGAIGVMLSKAGKLRDKS
jgi:chromate transporter